MAKTLPQSMGKTWEAFVKMRVWGLLGSNHSISPHAELMAGSERYSV